MKKVIYVHLAIVLLLTPLSIFARGYADGDTHEVKTYERSNETVVEEHRAGNPGSGVHCHDNDCESAE